MVFLVILAFSVYKNTSDIYILAYFQKHRT